MKFYAHSVEGKPASEWHRLEEHLLNVAELAKKFGDEFGCGSGVYSGVAALAGKSTIHI